MVCVREEAALVVGVDRLLEVRLELALMVEYFGRVGLSRVLVHIPRRILDELGHMFKVNFFDIAFFATCRRCCTAIFSYRTSLLLRRCSSWTRHLFLHHLFNL